LKHDMDLVPSPSQTVGPFFKIELTTDEHCVKCIAGPRAKGERIWIRFRVLDGEGAPVNDAMLEIWQADANGRYNHPDDPESKKVDPGWIGFGRLATGEDGSCTLETIKPGRMLKQLYTRVYFAGEGANDQDPALQIVPPDRRETLMARPDAGPPGYWHFDVRLQGDQETVFFDV
jgi:protocatechuate 3,4-dioxygenase alpha subunit